MIMVHYPSFIRVADILIGNWLIVSAHFCQFLPFNINTIGLRRVFAKLLLTWLRKRKDQQFKTTPQQAARLVNRLRLIVQAGVRCGVFCGGDLHCHRSLFSLGNLLVPGLILHLLNEGFCKKTLEPSFGSCYNGRRQRLQHRKFFGTRQPASDNTTTPRKYYSRWSGTLAIFGMWNPLGHSLRHTAFHSCTPHQAHAFNRTMRLLFCIGAICSMRLRDVWNVHEDCVLERFQILEKGSQTSFVRFFFWLLTGFDETNGDV